MKIKFIVTALFLFVTTFVFSQSKDIDKELKEGIAELSQILESLDLNKLINEDLIAEIDRLKPSEKELEDIESKLKLSIEAMEKIDFSAFEDIFREMEKAMSEIAPTIEPSTPEQKKSKPATKGKRI